MSDFALTTPVALLVFNRPETTARVFAAIREARPTHLLVVADGPRVGRADDCARCAEVRRIVEQVDWPCKIRHNYANVNLGCRQRVASGLDWVFDQVEDAIILEDDCLPDPTFFRFCQELLEFYRHDERIMMLCGTNLLGRWMELQQSYHFSHYDWVWGWASWRRAWRHYDVGMSLWGEVDSRKKIRDLLSNGRYYALRKKMFEQSYTNKIDTWDYQWTFSRLMQAGLSIIPSVNLVSNIGYGECATHTKVMDGELSAMPTQHISFPLKHQSSYEIDLDYDLAIVNMMEERNTVRQRIIRFTGLLMMNLSRLINIRRSQK